MGVVGCSSGPGRLSGNAARTWLGAGACLRAARARLERGGFRVACLGLGRGAFGRRAASRRLWLALAGSRVAGPALGQRDSRVTCLAVGAERLPGTLPETRAKRLPGNPSRPGAGRLSGNLPRSRFRVTPPAVPPAARPPRGLRGWQWYSQGRRAVARRGARVLRPGPRPGLVGGTASWFFPTPVRIGFSETRGAHQSVPGRAAHPSAVPGSVRRGRPGGGPPRALG